MTRTYRFSSLLLAAVSLSALAGTTAQAQTNGSNPQDEEEEIVVTGQRERGSVIGDVKPEQQLRAADVRALGVSNINDLLTELGPQLESASGKPPVTLLEGHRIASFREIASIPAEAIARVDILPEEVGLHYGYSADQKVMNIVLRQRFRAFTGEVSTRIPTAGQGVTNEVEAGHLSIRRGQRLNLNAEYTDTGGILESDRGLTSPESASRSLTSQREELTVNGSYNRPLSERTQATLSGEIGTARTGSFVGLALPSVTIPGGTLYAGGAADRIFYPIGPSFDPLNRSNSTQSGRISGTISAQRSSGQWTLTGTYSRQESRGLTDRPYDLQSYRTALVAGNPAADPTLPVAAAYLIARPADETQNRTDNANIDFIYNRTLFALPAGDISATARVSGSMLRVENSQNRDFVVTGRRIGRDSGSGSLNLDFPISRQTGALGRISANANAAIEQLSDAGTLRTFGFGMNWTPRRGINISASYRDEETAPTATQLGDAIAVTQFVPVFDYVRGESVLVTTISGGNPLLDAARDRNFRLGLVLNPISDPNVTVSFDYNHRSTSGGITNFPGITAETTAAFPGRFTRDGTGRLIQVDLRPINITEQKRDSLRWGINLSKRLKTPQSQINAMREAFQRRFPNGVPGAPGVAAGPGAGRERAATPADGAPPADPPMPPPGAEGGPPPGGFGRPGGGGRGPGGGGRGFGGPGGGGPGGGGRINFAIYHEWAFSNTTQLAPTLPVLDLLDGDSLGGNGGPSRHQIEVQAGINQSGYGLRLTGEWKSATHVDGVAGVPTSQLRFGDLATVDLRLFANLTQMPKLVEKMPFLRGSRITIGIDNLFNSKQKVTDGTGAVPFAYQPAFIDPTGRTVRVSFRKLFF
jgi:iron complex outermembrane receptor protein